MAVTKCRVEQRRHPSCCSSQLWPFRSSRFGLAETTRARKAVTNEKSFLPRSMAGGKLVSRVNGNPISSDGACSEQQRRLDREQRTSKHCQARSRSSSPCRFHAKSCFGLTHFLPKRFWRSRRLPPSSPAHLFFLLHPPSGIHLTPRSSYAQIAVVIAHFDSCLSLLINRYEASHCARLATDIVSTATYV